MHRHKRARHMVCKRAVRDPCGQDCIREQLQAGVDLPWAWKAAAEHDFPGAGYIMSRIHGSTTMTAWLPLLPALFNQGAGKRYRQRLKRLRESVERWRKAARGRKGHGRVRARAKRNDMQAKLMSATVLGPSRLPPKDFVQTFLSDGVGARIVRQRYLLYEATAAFGERRKRMLAAAQQVRVSA